MKGKFKTVEEVIKNAKNLHLNIGYLNAIIEGQNKELEFMEFDEGKGFLCKDFKNYVFEREDIVFNGMIWKPDVGESYYFVTLKKDNSFSSNDDDLVDNEAIKDNRTVKTEEEAEFYRKKLLRYLAELRWWYENDDHYEFIPGNENFYIFIDNESTYIDSAISVRSKNTIYYSSRKKAQDCLDWLKENGWLS